MSKLNADGRPRKKYVSKKMRMANNRKVAQKKAWVTRRALYPETNGYKPSPPAGLEIIDEIVDAVVALEPEPEHEKIIKEGKSGVAEMLRGMVFDLEKKLDAADAVNRNLNAIIKKYQEEVDTLKNKETAPSKLLSGEAHRLRDREVELEEQVKDLNQHNSLLTGELRGANYCFSKLAEEMSKGKEGA